MLESAKKSLKLKLFGAFFVLNMFVLFILGAISYSTASRAMTDQLENNLTLISSQLAENVDRYLSERLSDTRAIALHYSLFNIKTTTSSQNEVLARYLKIYPYYERINIINIEDIRLPEGIEKDSAEPWYYRAMSGDATSSDMYISSLTDSPTMSFAAPVYDESGKIVSVITTNLDLDYLWDIVDRIERENERKGLTGYAYMLNHKGLLIAYTDRSKLFTNDLFSSPDKSLQDAFKEMSAGHPGVVRYTFEGEDKYAAYSPCDGFGDYKGHGWSVGVTYPHSELMSPLEPLLKMYVIIFLVATLLSLVISTLVSNYLVKPIISLREGAGRIGNGDFGFRIRTDSDDELGELATSFNTMAETLQQRDRQINDYTKTLTDINRELEHKQDELEKTNEMLVHTNEELLRLERQKADFTAMITHDIKSPLSTIMTYADMVLGGSIPLTEDDMKKSMRSIFISGHKILTLVDNFLISSAIEAGRFQINLSALDINSFVKEESEHFGPQMEKKGIIFSYEPGRDVPLVKADRVQLDRAFSNILSNSIKFTPDGGSISVVTGKENDQAFVTITDSGRGIKPGDIDRIFGKFSRADEAAQVEGVGLGLFISRAIVEAHGGRLSAGARDEGGSSFTIYLPVAE